MELTPEDVRDIVRALDSSDLDELHLDLGEITLSVRREGAAGWSAEQRVRREPTMIDADSSTATEAAPTAERPAQDTPAGLLAVRPPLLGTFYRAPQPGADPFVEVGSQVSEETVVGIIETMKMMTPVPAGVRGTVAQFRAGNGDFVEADAVLLLVDPAS
jgi:acetyl-CoA carboxylase biotin carboxyl carrier protein